MEHLNTKGQLCKTESPSHFWQEKLYLVPHKKRKLNYKDVQKKRKMIEKVERLI
jgi:hypothetical protein